MPLIIINIGSGLRLQSLDISDDNLVSPVLSLQEEDPLCVPKDDVEAREPKIICSLVIRKDQPMKRGKQSSIEVQGTDERINHRAFNSLEFEGIRLASANMLSP